MNPTLITILVCLGITAIIVYFIWCYSLQRDIEKTQEKLDTLGYLLLPILEREKTTMLEVLSSGIEALAKDLEAIASDDPEVKECLSSIVGDIRNSAKKLEK